MKSFLLIFVLLFTVCAFSQVHVTASVDGFTQLFPVNDFEADAYSVGGTVGFLAPASKNFYYGASTGYYTDREDLKAVPTIAKGRVDLGGLVLELNAGVYWFTEPGQDFKPVFNSDLLVGFKLFEDLPARFAAGLRLLDDDVNILLSLSY